VKIEIVFHMTRTIHVMHILLQEFNEISFEIYLCLIRFK